MSLATSEATGIETDQADRRKQWKRERRLFSFQSSNVGREEFAGDWAGGKGRTEEGEEEEEGVSPYTCDCRRTEARAGA